MRYTDEQARALIDLEIKVAKHILEILPAIEQTITAFNGQPIGERLKRALKSIDKNLRLEYFRHDSFRIVYDYMEPCEFSDGSYGYLYERSKKICSIFVRGTKFVDEFGRLMSQTVLENIHNTRYYLREFIDIIPAHIELVSVYQHKIEEIKHDLHILNESIPKIIKQYYDLGFSFHL